MKKSHNMVDLIAT